MARLTTPKDALKCKCGINVRESELIDAGSGGLIYSLCPSCKSPMIMWQTDPSDTSQKPITIKTVLDQGSADHILGMIRYRSMKLKE